MLRLTRAANSEREAGDNSSKTLSQYLQRRQRIVGLLKAVAVPGVDISMLKTMVEGDECI